MSLQMIQAKELYNFLQNIKSMHMVKVNLHGNA